MRGALSAVVLVLAACGGRSSTGTADAPPGGPDGGRADVVACGTAAQPTTCALPDMACCDFAPGAGNDYCFPVAGGVCEGGAPILCDGPEDCSGGDICCYQPNTGSSCAPPVECMSGGDAVMCHVGDTSTCDAGESCCGLHASGPSSGGPFGICRVGSCPV